MLDTVENGYTLFHITIGSRGALRKCHVTTWPPRSRDTFTLRRTVASATVHRKAKRIYKKQDLLSMLGSHVISKKKNNLHDSLGLSLVFLTVYAPVNTQRSMDLVSPHCLYLV